MMILFISSEVYAQSLCQAGQGYINRPAQGYGITSNMGPRNCSGCSSNHPGTDYGTPCGSQIAGPPPGCIVLSSTGGQGSATSGYGNRIQFDCGTNSAGETIRIQYAHLQTASYNPTENLITTGNSGAGGCHLDYILTVNGQTIDAQCSTGTVSTSVYEYGNSSTRHGAMCPIAGQPNLCDPAVTAQLVQHGSAARQGTTSGPGSLQGGGGGGTPPAPPDGPTRPPTNATPGYPTSGTGGGTTPSQPGVIAGYDRTPNIGQPYLFQNPTPGRCDTTTCITATTFANSNANFMDAVDMEYQMITPGACLPATSTGSIVSRQIDGQRDYYEDRFCLNSGCSYLRGGACQ